MTAVRRRPVWIENGAEWRDREIGYLLSRPGPFGRRDYTLSREPGDAPVGRPGVDDLRTHGVARVVSPASIGGHGLRARVQPLALDITSPPVPPALEIPWHT